MLKPLKEKNAQAHILTIFLRKEEQPRMKRSLSVWNGLKHPHGNLPFFTNLN